MTWNQTAASGDCIDFDEWNTMAKYIQQAHYSGANNWNSHNFQNSGLCWDDSLKKWKASKSGAAIGAGVDTFLELTDAPDVYSGKSGQLVLVNGAENALVFGSMVCTLSDVIVQNGNVVFNV